MMHESRDAALQIIAAANAKLIFPSRAARKWLKERAGALHSFTFPGAKSPKVHTTKRLGRRRAAHTTSAQLP